MGELQNTVIAALAGKQYQPVIVERFRDNT